MPLLSLGLSIETGKVRHFLTVEAGTSSVGPTVGLSGKPFQIIFLVANSLPLVSYLSEITIIVLIQMPILLHDYCWDKIPCAYLFNHVWIEKIIALCYLNFCDDEINIITLNKALNIDPIVSSFVHCGYKLSIWSATSIFLSLLMQIGLNDTLYSLIEVALAYLFCDLIQTSLGVAQRCTVESGLSPNAATNVDVALSIVLKLAFSSFNAEMSSLLRRAASTESCHTEKSS